MQCNHKWFATVPAEVSIFKLECSECGYFDSFCAPLMDEYLAEFNKSAPVALRVVKGGKDEKA